MNSESSPAALWRPPGLPADFPHLTRPKLGARDWQRAQIHAVHGLQNLGTTLVQCGGSLQTGFLHADVVGVWIDGVILTGRQLWHLQLYASGPHHALRDVQLLDRLLTPYRPILNADGLAQEFNFCLREGAGPVPEAHLQSAGHWRLRRVSGPEGTVNWKQSPSALMTDQMALAPQRITVEQPGRGRPPHTLTYGRSQ